MNAKKNVILAAMGLVMATTAVTGASAETRFERTHNHRVAVVRHVVEVRKVKAIRRHEKAQLIRVHERNIAARHRVIRIEKARLNREDSRIHRHVG